MTSGIQLFVVPLHKISCISVIQVRKSQDMNVTRKEENIIKAAGEGMDSFVKVFYDAIMDSVGGEITADNMSRLTTDQLTLVAYVWLRDEVMDGGFVQLIHNGYGSFIFDNPFAKMMKEWGIKELSKLLYAVRKLYVADGEEIEKDCSDEEFMSLFEKYPAFDDFDDTFVENEEEWTGDVAHYIDEHIENFANVEK